MLWTLRVGGRHSTVKPCTVTPDGQGSLPHTTSSLNVALCSASAPRQTHLLTVCLKHRPTVMQYTATTHFQHCCLLLLHVRPVSILSHTFKTMVQCESWVSNARRNLATPLKLFNGREQDGGGVMGGWQWTLMTWDAVVCSLQWEVWACGMQANTQTSGIWYTVLVEYQTLGCVQAHRPTPQTILVCC